MSDGGKGSRQRPTDWEKFSASFDEIFGVKKEPEPEPKCSDDPVRKSDIYRWIKPTGNGD